MDQVIAFKFQEDHIWAGLLAPGGSTPLTWRRLLVKRLFFTERELMVDDGKKIRSALYFPYPY